MPNTCYSLNGRAEYNLSRKIKMELIEENIAAENGEIFIIIHIFLFMAHTGIRKPFMISRRTGWHYQEVRHIVGRLKQLEYLINGELYLEETLDPISDIITLVLMAGVVAGKIRREFIKNEDN